MNQKHSHQKNHFSITGSYKTAPQNRFRFCGAVLVLRFLNRQNDLYKMNDYFAVATSRVSRIIVTFI